MLTRAHFISSIEKAAAESAVSPNYSLDNAQIARREHTANRGDSKSYLKGLFDNAGAVEQNNTKTMDSLLPSKSGMDRETSNPLLKVAFYTRVGGELSKIASDSRRLSYREFLWELQKIAASQIEGMMRALGKGTQAVGQAVKPTAPAMANKAMQGFRSLHSNPIAMPSMPGLPR